ncbi:MAG: transposase, partial [Desulfobacterales bacterium]|nr:transposase [Desulfobacterales bacterium]
MIHTKDHKTLPIFDPWDFLGPKRRKLMDQSWAGLFRKHILNDLPVGKLRPFFTSGFGRPTKELYSILGAIVLQQMHDLSDEQTVCQVAFNQQWHYALDITDSSDQATYLCEKTLWNFRTIMTENNLDTHVFNQTAEKLAQVFNVNTEKQRLDSVHIKSNMRHLSRIGIFSKSIHRFLVNLKRHYPELLEQVDSEMVDRYLTKKALACFSMVKPSESATTLDQVSRDLFSLVQQFSAQQHIGSMHSYKLLERVLQEQCTVVEAATDKDDSVAVKPPREIAQDSLQNPSDPD